MKKYAHFNPNTGQYSVFDTREEVLSSAVDAAFQFFVSHTHGQPFAEIEVDESGTETWSAAHDGSPMLSPAQLLTEGERMQRHMESFINAQQMPVTKLGTN
jgi:hypothetical protein